MNSVNEEVSDSVEHLSSLNLSIPPSSRLHVSTSFYLTVILFLALFPAVSFAQRNSRPTLQPATRADLAGRIVLLPGDDRFLELRMLAQIADHYLILPPSRLMTPKPQPDELLKWLKAQNPTAVSAVIVSINTADVAPILKQFRAQNSSLPIYGFASLDSSIEASKQSCLTAIELLADGVLNFLLIGQGEDLSAKPAQIVRARLAGESASREIGDRVAFTNNPKSMAATTLARMLAARFGRSPKTVPVYSSGEGRLSRDENSIPLNQSIAAAIKLVGANLLPQTQESAPLVEVLLFIHTPQTTDEQRTALAMNVLQTVDSGARVTFLDVSESQKTKDAMLAELRQHKVIGKLTAFASAIPGEEPGDALNRAMAQTAIFFAAIRSLRNDIDRVHRIERAQVNLLFSRILEDWGYNTIVRPRLDEFVRSKLRSEPDKMGDNIELAEKLAFGALQKLAAELFDEQFRRNTHAILMNSGTRVQFRVSVLQQLQIRFPSQNIFEPEIKQTIHTFFDGYLPGSGR
ncbi:MAG: DUF4127 family protein [Blastocatellia bacterium]